MKDIKCIALDLDGTLMNSKDQIHPDTLEKVRELTEKGICVLPCTGRCRDLIPKELREGCGIRYGITSNGADTRDFTKSISINKVKMAEGTVPRILEYLEGKKGYVEIFCDGKSYAKSWDVEKIGKTETNKTFITYFQNNHVLAENLYEQKMLWDQAEKLNIFCMEEKDRLYLKDRLEETGLYQVTSSIAGNIEINDKMADKGLALKTFCEQMGIGRDQVIAVGDGDNDLGMLRYAGYGVAMANGIEELKAEADFVTKSNEENGVLWFLNQL